MTRASRTNSREAFDMAALLQGMSVPGFDFGALLDMQRRNFEALLNANKVAAEGYQALINRQAEIVQSTLQEASAALQKVSSGELPADAANSQLEAARASFEKALDNFRELANIAQDAGTESIRIVQDRMNATVAEWRQMAVGSA